MAKTPLFTGFRSRHYLRVFEKRVNTSVLCVHQDKKKRFKKSRTCCNLQGSGTVTGKNLHKYQRFSVQKLPKHCYLHCLVPATFSWKCKNPGNTSTFCDEPSKNAVIYRSFFGFALKNGGICSVLCISSPKSIDIYSICCVFALLPQKKLNRKNAVIYSILSISKSEKSSQKCVKTTLFSEFRYPQNRGGRGNALGDASERPGFRPKSFPQQSEGFLVFFGAGVGVFVVVVAVVVVVVGCWLSVVGCRLSVVGCRLSVVGCWLLFVVVGCSLFAVCCLLWLSFPCRCCVVWCGWTSKKWSEHGVFCHFNFDMCFAPQQCALFPHLNLRKWSRHVVFLPFWLRNVLRATTCAFSTSQLLKVLRSWCVLYSSLWHVLRATAGCTFFDISIPKSVP